MTSRFEGRVAAVTGGASGIGAAIAERLASEGAQVAVLDRENPANGCHWEECDVSNSEQVERAVEGVARTWGRIDIVVNNAGIGAQGDVGANSDEEWVRAWEVNVAGIARVSRAALPYLRESDAASIINMASIAATAGLQQRALYSATKGAVLALTPAYS